MYCVDIFNTEWIYEMHSLLDGHTIAQYTPEKWPFPAPQHSSRYFKGLPVNTKPYT